MTQKLITRQALHRASRELHLAWEALEQCAQQMKRHDVPHLPLHGENYLDKLIPQMAKWATKLEGEVKLGVQNYLDGLESLETDPDEAPPAEEKPAASKPARKKSNGR